MNDASPNARGIAEALAIAKAAGKKRKREAAEEAAGQKHRLRLKAPHGQHQVNIVRYQQQEPTPLWIPPGVHYSGTLEERLTQEILDFVRCMEPTRKEIERRHELVAQYEKLIQTRLRGAMLRIFGSLGTELLLPTSDLDLVISDPNGPKDPGKEQMKKGLAQVASTIKKSGLPRSFAFIKNARIPIFKLTDKETAFDVDISYNNTTGCDAIPAVKGLLNELPSLRPLVFVLKQFLHVRGLNRGDIGGVGGYGLVCWVAGFLRLHSDIFVHRYPRNPAAEASSSSQGPSASSGPGLGVLFLDFLLMFGFLFDYHEQGLDPGNPDGVWLFRKQKRDLKSPANSHLLSIQDPSNRHHDVGKTASKINVVTSHLAAAYDALVEADRKLGGDVQHRTRVSMLGKILNVQSEVLLSRVPPPLNRKASKRARRAAAAAAEAAEASRLPGGSPQGRGPSEPGSERVIADFRPSHKEGKRDRRQVALPRGRPGPSQDNAGYMQETGRARPHGGTRSDDVFGGGMSYGGPSFSGRPPPPMMGPPMRRGPHPIYSPQGPPLRPPYPVYPPPVDYMPEAKRRRGG
ncbi:uncharacterized protein SPPG_06247 [Spizellomyces punctatus DAOM BR117]|uniref:polynucleotide adenylyltransferase n=1 Tax=Spizellomyces punctatus (strain DAOM BR117) TaxID=645134 RepID=A0A0L0HCV3_SPIPD|nr:uncharacterized protein SPPG_06247 [Spizellomyces punctatus DAOM BR117]KNC98558.1 hypothetical protein SPPG_06247 [Spizellomyces punctatus DAOM BR117]|eukprot:XP_016606598.1 hypothetical protein SPPG_06247 [Spizellomyces punctatus DAOM BR117]